MISPHGGKLINRIAEERLRQRLIHDSKTLYKIKISKEHAQELTNIATGVFSPLKGFLSRKDFKSVISKRRLSSNIAWTIPIVLDIPSFIYPEIKKQKKISLIDERGITLAVMEIEDIYTYNKEDVAKRIYGTTSISHLGVSRLLSAGEYLVGGKIMLLEHPHYIYKKYTLTPQEVRDKFLSLGWKEIAAFQTRNVPHIGHEYVQKTALSYVDGLFINPVIGKKKKGDFKDNVILDSYKALIKNYYPKDHVVLSALQMQMRYAGPLEAIHHAIIRKNFGCTHIIIGRDHAGVGNFYHPFAAHEIFKEFNDLEIQPIFFKSFFRCKICGTVANDKTCPHKGDDIINFSGTKIRDFLVKGRIPSPKLMRPEVAREIIKHKNPFVE